MLKRIFVIGSSLTLFGCGIMPGMQNLESSNLRTISEHHNIQVRPIIIPITPSLIADQKVSTYHYRVAPSDVLYINVWQHPEFDLVERITPALATTAGVQGAAGQYGYLVNANGQIYFPLIGYVTVGGKTIESIHAIITNRLKKYVPNPQINVRVADYRGRKVYVLGEVGKTGIVPITDQVLTIADALAFSGGISPDSADPRHIYVIRGKIEEPLIFWLDAKTPEKMLLAERFSLQPRDILFVSSAPATRWNRALNQILPTVQTVWYTQAIVKNS